MKVSTGKIHTIMKTKNIFLTAISALFIFAACTEEKIIDAPGVSGKGDLCHRTIPLFRHHKSCCNKRRICVCDRGRIECRGLLDIRVR